MTAIQESVTLILRRVSKGPDAWDAIYRRTYGELRKIATRLLNGERAGHTLQPTALVHESFVKLYRMESGIDGEAHFYNLSARAMRQVLIDHARSRGQRRQVDAASVAEMMMDLRDVSLSPELQITLNDALARLRRIDSAAAETVWLRCAEGATIQEVARRQQREPWRVRADCDFALGWLASRLRRA